MLTEISDANSIPLPRKLFSDTPKAKVPPPVPTPAPAIISPVGFSSTVILIIFLFSLSISKISDSTLLKKLSPLKLFNVLVCSNSLKASPSSTRRLFRITSSRVTLLPSMLIFST